MPNTCRQISNQTKAVSVHYEENHMNSYIFSVGKLCYQCLPHLFAYKKAQTMDHENQNYCNIYQWYCNTALNTSTTLSYDYKINWLNGLILYCNKIFQFAIKLYTKADVIFITYGTEFPCRVIISPSLPYNQLLYNLVQPKADIFNWNCALLRLYWIKA